ncbi:PREDICTED: major facilitator superfamily domain-containing protein 7-a-like [Priapulus caudatus]|uniref:Major facilitator superfamily domain-containing protein 7-a-like n=1 Tax=Priapulus caudatus TaxID=37621 RepID=A0ABM1DNN4_PRICU|nr:PREDICTED: major facilitator superfamily domain-containing protein 7-a-like [Priapulus caudatus]
MALRGEHDEENCENLVPAVRLYTSINDESQYTVYKWRWFVLATLTLIAASNGMIWLSMSTVANYAADYYDVSLEAINWLSIVYFITTVILGIPAIYMLEHCGLRASILAAAWLNALGQLVRVLSQYDDRIKFPLMMGGQTISSFAQPLILFMPAKLAAVWFPDGQRTLATTIGSLGQTLGMLAATTISPPIVSHHSHIPLLNDIIIGPAVLAVVMATFGVCSSTPPTAPSGGAEEEGHTQSIITGIKQVMVDKMYLLLVFISGAGFAVFCAILTLMTQFLCPQGYSDEFAGWCSALMIIFGFIGSVIVGIIVDKTKLYAEITKTALALTSITLSIFVVFSLQYNQEIPLAILASLVGIAALPVYPLVQEMAVEMTYPVHEAISVGILNISCCIQSAVVVVLLPLLAKPLSSAAMSHETCSTNPHSGGVTAFDQTAPVLALSAFAALSSILTIVGLRPRYHRMEMEHRDKVEE